MQFGCAKLDHLEDISDIFQKNLKNGLRRDVITRFIQC